MRISNKHQNVQNIIYADFSGGLNMTNAPEYIQQNELAACENVEVAKGQLRTCAGTDTVLEDTAKSFDNLIFDRINSRFLLTDTAGAVYLVKGTALQKLGTLTGKGTLTWTAWESGVLLASGGKLQYYDGTALQTLSNSPDKSTGVFVKSGRVWTSTGDELHASAVGDETTWATDDNDASSGQWLQVGYKDGGTICGLCSLTSDLLIFKSNRRAYHLAGDYPDWQLLEVGRQIDCKGWGCCVALADRALYLGHTDLSALTATDAYGDFAAASLSEKVAQDIAALGTVRVRFLPSLRQVWLLEPGKKRFLFLDVQNGGYYRRAYNVPVRDAVDADGTVYVLKDHSLCKLTTRHMQDEGRDLGWQFQAKTVLGGNQILVKRVRIDTTPFFSNAQANVFYVGHVTLHGGGPPTRYEVFGNEEEVYGNQMFVNTPAPGPVYTSSPEVYSDYDEVWGNEDYLIAPRLYRVDTRCCDRERAVIVRARGAGGQMIFNTISYEAVEV